MSLTVFFDMDGVLIDSQPLHYELDMRVLKSCGYPAELSTVTPYTGIGNPDRWPKYKEDLGLEEEPARLIELAEEAMRDIFTNADLTPIEGIPQLLDGIKAMGIKCGVASSSSHELIELVLTKIGLKDRFEYIISGEDVSEGKPNPEIYLKAAEKASTTPQQCIAIEDAPAGVEAAKSAGMTCIVYNNPNTHGQDFSKGDFTANKFDDCFPIIKTLFFRSVMGSLS